MFIVIYVALIDERNKPGGGDGDPEPCPYQWEVVKSGISYNE